MKASYSWYVLFFVLGAIAMVAAQNLLFVKVTAQQPPIASEERAFDLKLDTPNAQAIVVEQRADGTLIYRSPDGKIIRRANVPVPPGHDTVLRYGVEGRTTYAYAGPSVADPEAAKLYQEELQAAQNAQKLAAELRAADSEGDREKIKAQLREKLLTIFELQQKRRAHEVAKIEERLAKLKETMKKRDSSKDEIIDRRLDILTGGIDELGWEETFPLGGPNPNAARGYPVPKFQPHGVPTVEPSAVLPTPALEIPPATTVPRANTPVSPVPGFDSLPPAAAPAGAAPPATPAVPRPATSL